MPPFFIILLKVNCVLILFTLAYYFILRRLTFYVINRIFLLFGIIFSSLYPFIDLTSFFHSQQQLNPQVVAFVPDLTEKISTFFLADFITKYWSQISIILYTGIAIMAVRLLLQFIVLYSLHKKSSKGLVADVPVRILDEQVSPFSFWQTIYINPAAHKEAELTTILAHEDIHIKEWHTLDILLAELSVVFYWFNPGAWLMKKAIKENLEFITDEKVLQKGVNKKNYQYSLIDVSTLNSSTSLVNSFTLPDVKKRIRMMNVKRSSRVTLGRYVLVVPVLLLVTLAFTLSKKYMVKDRLSFKEFAVNQAPAVTKNTITQQKPVVKRKKPATVQQTAVAPLEVLPELKKVNGIHLEEGSSNEKVVQGKPIMNFTKGIKLEGKPVAPPATNNTAEEKADEKVITVVGYSTKKSTQTADSTKANNPL